MRQYYKSELSKRQKIKARISRQEKYPFPIFLILALMIVGIYSATSSGMIQIIPVISGLILLLLFFLLIFVIIVYPRAIIWRQKKKWMHHYGEQITAVVTGMQSSFGVPSLYLEWCHPQTGQIYHYKIVVPRSQLNLAYGYETGSQFLLWIDPEDPGFSYPSMLGQDTKYDPS